MAFIKTIRLTTLFSGIGAPEKALRNKRVDYDLIHYCEFDKHASKSYSLIHDVSETLNIGDITQVDETLLDDFDLLVFGSPCQDFSAGGKKKGASWTCKTCGFEFNPLTVFPEDREKCPSCGIPTLDKTRSSLVVEGLRIVREKKPKYVIYENVKNLVGKQFIDVFHLFLKELESYGYAVSHKVLNSSEFGVPQARERIFVVGIKDTDSPFVFPEGDGERVVLEDILEVGVDSYYNLSEKITKTYKRHARFNDPTYLEGVEKKKPRTLQDGYLQGVKFEQRGRVYSPRGVSPTVVTKPPNVIYEDRIRWLTPLECFRLMGFDDEDHNVLERNEVSVRERYKQAGNSIVVNVLEAILDKLLKENEE